MWRTPCPTPHQPPAPLRTAVGAPDGSLGVADTSYAAASGAPRGTDIGIDASVDDSYGIPTGAVFDASTSPPACAGADACAGAAGAAVLMRSPRRRRARRQHGDDGADFDGVAFLGEDLRERARRRTRHLRVHLVGADLEERLVEFDRLADGLVPRDHRPFRDRFAHLGHRHLDARASVGAQRAAGGGASASGAEATGAAGADGAGAAAGAVWALRGRSSWRCRNGRCGRGCRRGGGRGSVGFALPCGVAAGVDAGDDGADLDGVAFLGEDLGERARRRTRHLRVHLVGADLEQRLVELDRLADGLVPRDHRPFRDRFAHLGHGDV